jgi:ferredoxin
MTLVNITITGDGSIPAQVNTRLVLALEDGGIDILHRCGGFARCTTCRVEVLEGDAAPMTEREGKRLSRVKDVLPTTRLSCQTVVEGDITVSVANRLSDSPFDDAGPRPTDAIES